MPAWSATLMRAIAGALETEAASLKQMRESICHIADILPAKGTS